MYKKVPTYITKNISLHNGLSGKNEDNINKSATAFRQDTFAT